MGRGRVRLLAPPLDRRAWVGEPGITETKTRVQLRITVFFRATRDDRVHDLGAIYRAHHAFVWRTLYHFGLRGDEVGDSVQDVFLVVHRRLEDFDGRTPIRNWLYGIARRVASDARKRGQRRATHLRLVPDPSSQADERRLHEQASAARLVDRFLELLDDDKREVFVLAEVEGMTAPEIAEILGVNVNTIYARLRAARLRFQREVDRQQSIERREQAWSS
jgi:RNA polymerase sigma-70 factor, ECF subfamily